MARVQGSGWGGLEAWGLGLEGERGGGGEGETERQDIGRWQRASSDTMTHRKFRLGEGLAQPGEDGQELRGDDDDGQGGEHTLPLRFAPQERATSDQEKGGDGDHGREGKEVEGLER